MEVPDFANMTGSHFKESNLSKRFPEFCEYINQKYSSVPFRERLYWYVNDLTEQPLCPVCGKPSKFINFSKGYYVTCSLSCARHYQPFIDKKDRTCLERYGVKNVASLKEVREKTKQTCLEKYGTNCSLQTPQALERMHKSNLKKYGIGNPFKSKEFQKHMQEENLKKYGIPVQRVPEIVEKRKTTNLKKYGVDNVFKSSEFRETIKKHNIEKYGVEYPAQNKEVYQKNIQTNIERYGVPYTCMREEARNLTNDSIPNQRFAQLLEENNISYEREYTIDRFSYDFKVGDTLIELNPTPTHNSTWGILSTHGKSKKYHSEKTDVAKRLGFRCIHIWDWDNTTKIIQCLKPRETVYARNCVVKEIDKKSCDQFLDKYHLQGTCNNQKIKIGIFLEDCLIGVMTFGKPRYNSNYNYELIRLCCCKNIVGGEEKMFSYFVDHYSPNNIISYCDASKFTGKVYSKLGFVYKSTSQPAKHWYNIKTEQHITDNLLRQRGFDQLFGTSYGKGTSNEELMKQNKFVEIYDCGQMTFVYEKS